MKKRAVNKKKARLKDRRGVLLRSMCPIANALDFLGDKWTLVIVRDMLLLDKRTYSDFTFSSEAIPTNILAQRLKRLEKCGFVTKEPYQTKPPRFRYVPTAKVEDLLPVLIETIRWSNKHIPGTTAPPPGFLEKLSKQGARGLRQGLREAKAGKFHSFKEIFGANH